MNKKSKTITWIVLGLLLLGVLFFLFRGIVSPRFTEVSDTVFNEQIMSLGDGDKAEIHVSGYNVQAKIVRADGSVVYIKSTGQSKYDPNNEDIQKWRDLGSAKCEVYFADPNSGSIWSSLVTLGGIVLVSVVFYLIMRSAAGGGKVMNVGKTKAHMQNNMKVRFSDVAGAEEEKEELQEVVEFLKTPKRFSDLGARIPRGVLLVGPPGTGKTLFAKAVAGEAGVPFFSVSGSDFVEMYVGVGAARVRDLFDVAKKNQPCIIFIDEIDAVGRRRGAGLGGGHDEREQTLNQILVQMDGFETNEGIIVMAATNRADILDPALLRP